MKLPVAQAFVLLVGCSLPLGAAPAHPACDVQTAVKGLQRVHETLVQTANLCLKFHNDVYQRFSGYVVKHRIGGVCEHALAILDGLRRVFVAASSRPGESAAAGCGPGDNFKDGSGAHSSQLQVAAEGAIGVIGACNALGKDLREVLEDINLNGDGSFHRLIVEHLESLAGTLLQLVHLSENAPSLGSRLQWMEVAQQVAEAVGNICKAMLEQLDEAVTYNVAALNITDLPRFLSLLGSFPAAVPVDVHRGDTEGGEGAACVDVPAIYWAHHVFDPIAEPEGWRSHDISGLLTARPPVQKLLFAISKAVPLSYNLVAIAPRVQVGSQELTSEYRRMFESTGGVSAPSSAALSAAGSEAVPGCGKIGLAHSPPECLIALGWGSMMFSLSTEPPFDGVLAVAEMSQKGAARPVPFVQPVANGTKSLDMLMDLVDGVYKSLNTPSPDLLFLSPMVGNCLTLRRLGTSRRDWSGQAGGGPPPQLTPKLIWVPVNPLVAPPWELAPNFTLWHERWLEEQQNIEPSAWKGEAIWWFAQCSLASAVAVLNEQGYVLLHLEHSFAVFILKGLWASVSPLLRAAGPQQGPDTSQPASSLPLFDHWLEGWFCSPVAATLFGLEWIGGADLGKLHDRHQSAEAQQRALCDFVHAHSLPLNPGSTASMCEVLATRGVGLGGHLDPGPRRPPQSWRSWELQDIPEERGKAYLLESEGRGRCLSHLGFCECFPPYRGSFCESEEPGRHDASRGKRYRAVLHFLVGDKERLLNDFARTLPLLWDRFNARFDYPVVVFHDGLAPASRQRILEASHNRIWFAFVEDYTSVPAFLQGRMDLELGGYSLGYRGMCRFRSGPMFTQPVMRAFDYAWTLDTDGYFPAEITTDPFERMWEGGTVYGYSHISRDQASAVQHFWEFCRLYMETKGLDPKGTRIMRRITDALVLRDTYWHEWNRVLFMNDIEITQLAWFRGKEYQDFFRFLDSVGGFWLYRWGDHAVRTIAIALFLDPGLLMKMGVPYGHQNTCRCGEEHPEDVCVRGTSGDWWQCVPRENLPADAGLGTVASGSVGTVDESLLFGGS